MRGLTWAVLGAGSVAVLGVALLVGSVPLPLQRLLPALVGQGDDIARQIVLGLRLPRVLAAFACGGLLALAGTMLQVLLRNPLADPYVLGISGGAAVAALGAMLAGGAAVAVDLAALAGALAVIGAVLVLSWRAAGFRVERLLLAGVALSAGFTALVSVLLIAAPEAQVRGMLFWLMGDLARAGDPALPMILLPLVLAWGWHNAHGIDVLGLGEVKAASLGVPVRRLQLGMYLCAGAATAAVVTTAGPIGFVGLVMPHLVRLAGLRSHRVLLPAAVLAGGSFVTLADTVARTVAAPVQLPVGACIALIGAPALLILLLRRA